MARASEKVKYSTEVGVRLEEIDRQLRPASQMRMQLDRVAVAEYAEDLDVLPAVKLMVEQGKHWVVDGAHTISAAHQRGEKDVRAVIATGSYDDAYREASRCNGERGVRLQDGDKRHRVLQYAEELRRGKRKMTQQQIADICNVSQQYVSEILASRSPNAGFTVPCESPNTSASKPGRGRPRKARPAPTRERPAPPPEPEEVDFDEQMMDMIGMIRRLFEDFPQGRRYVFILSLRDEVQRLIKLTPGWKEPVEETYTPRP
jgi:hypothetical protein